MASTLHCRKWQAISLQPLAPSCSKLFFGFIWPGIVAAALFAFSLSFDEFVRTLLLTGFDRTLPVQLWYMIVESPAPEAPAMAVVLIVISVVSPMVGFAFSNRRSNSGRPR